MAAVLWHYYGLLWAMLLLLSALHGQANTAKLSQCQCPAAMMIVARISSLLTTNY
jgi:hypothetical protein